MQPIQESTKDELKCKLLGMFVLFNTPRLTPSTFSDPVSGGPTAALPEALARRDDEANEGLHWFPRAPWTQTYPERNQLPDMGDPPTHTYYQAPKNSRKETGK